MEPALIGIAGFAAVLLLKHVRVSAGIELRDDDVTAFPQPHLRFDARIVERLLKLQWWLYDLAPQKHSIDFARVEAALDTLEQRLADGRLARLQPDTYRVGPGCSIEKLATSLY